MALSIVPPTLRARCELAVPSLTFTKTIDPEAATGSTHVVWYDNTVDGFDRLSYADYVCDAIRNYKKHSKESFYQSLMAKISNRFNIPHDLSYKIVGTASQWTIREHWLETRARKHAIFASIGRTINCVPIFFSDAIADGSFAICQSHDPSTLESVLLFPPGSKMPLQFDIVWLREHSWMAPDDLLIKMRPVHDTSAFTLKQLLYVKHVIDSIGSMDTGITLEYSTRVPLAPLGTRIPRRAILASCQPNIFVWLHQLDDFMTTDIEDIDDD